METRFAFTSTMGDNTKVTLNADNGLSWAHGDQMFVYSYNGDGMVCQDVSTIFAGEGTSTGRFAPEAYADLSAWYDPDAVSLDYDFYAWYPFAPVADPDEKVISIPNVSTTQLEANGIGSYLICWAKAQTNKTALLAGNAPTFTFSPKSALLKLLVLNNSGYTINIDAIEVEADDNIAGQASLNLATGALSEGTASALTFTPSSPIVVAAGNKSLVPVYISILPCAATNLAITLKDGETSFPPVNIPFEGIESGRIYSRVASAALTIPRRDVDIANYTAQTATSDVLEAHKLYYGKANCLVMGASDTQGVLNIQLFESSDGFTRDDILSTYKTAVTRAKVIWAENDLHNDPNFGIIGADLRSLTIAKSSGVTGNALVGIYQGDELLWSYHVWCPADDSNYFDFVSELDTHFEAVYKLALGQISGEQTDSYMYYQWGRKDPLGRAASLSSTTSLVSIYGGASFTTVAATSTGKEANNLAYARKNPTKYITQNNETLYDWYPSKSTMTAQSNQENRLWNTAAATIYDPCPEGYHVAPKTLWEGTTSTKSSGNFSAGKTTKLWYVLGGARSRTDGSVNGVSSDGRYWSSEAVPSSVDAYGLGFGSAGSGLYREGRHNRAHTFGARCVK